MKRNLAFGLTLFAALLIIAGANPAAAATEQMRTQENVSFFVPCANGGLGEVVDGIMKAHFVFGVTEDGAGGFHLHAQVKLQGVGIGAVTGDTYRLHSDEPIIFADRINENAGGSFNGAFTISFDAISMGAGSNFHATLRDQVTYNANGVLTMERFEITETCN